MEITDYTPVTFTDPIKDYTERLPFLVYGTLRQGYGNSVLLNGAIENIDLVSLKGIALYSEPESVPFCYPKEDGLLVAEMVTVNEEDYANVLRRVDSLEGFRLNDDNTPSQTNLYNRNRVEFEHEGETVAAWIYLATEDPANSQDYWYMGPLVEHGDWHTNNIINGARH